MLVDGPWLAGQRWSDLVRARSSRRRFHPGPLDAEARAGLEAALAAAPPGPFGSAVRPVPVEATPEDPDALRGLGTYGFIRGASAFLVGAVRRGPRDLEDLGFVGEWLVLAATGLGLGTCWLGGTFARSRFAAAAGVADDETVPAVIALGHPTERHGLVERAVRAVARSSRRLPPEALFFDGAPDRPLDPAEGVGPALELVRLAPSSSNRQPWRLLRDPDGAVHLLLARTPGYRETNARLGIPDLQRLDMGIAMLHFAIGAAEIGLPGRWTPPRLAAPPAGMEPVATWSADAG